MKILGKNMLANIYLSIVIVAIKAIGYLKSV